ncbi:hypothetical protein BGX27_000251 [Mortierella sp. AM989]|nr:hypothetical protein BGX27_000251 [Mortierella sp. AM989]
MSEQEISLFHIYGYIKGSKRSGSHKADHAIQTIWESIGSSSDGSGATRKHGEKDKQCRLYVMDYTSIWKGKLTRQDWEAQRHSRCEDMVNKDLYESLTVDAFKGANKNESDKWGLALSVRSSNESSDNLELTWAGSVTNTIGGRSLQQKTILGTMTLEKVEPEESKAILKQWIKNTIEERQKFERLSNSLKAHVVGLDRQYKECKDLLVDFKLDKRRSQNDLLEKFRALINTKKEKIVKLVKSNNSLQERMELLENALKEERRKVAVLEGKKIEDTDIDLSDIKKQEGLETADAQSSASARGGRGRGRGTGRGRGRGRTIKNEESEEYVEPLGLVSRSRKKPLKSAVNASRSQDSQEADIELSQPLPHPQDGYGWNEDADEALNIKNEEGEEEDEEDEPLIRKSSRRNPKGSPSAVLPQSNTNIESTRHHLDDLSAGAQDLISRVSKAANIGSPHASPTKKTVKREDSDHLDPFRHSLVKETKSDRDQSLESRSPKRHKAEKNKDSAGKSNTTASPDNANVRLRSRYPVVSMRKTTVTKVVIDRNSTEGTPHSPLLRSFPSAESSAPEGVKRTRSSILLEASRRTDHANGRRTKDNAAVITASITSEEDLYKELE